MSTARYIRQLGSETAIYGISGTISRFIAIFLVPLYTRVFTPSDYGIIGSLASLTGLLSTFIVLGLDSASSRWYYDTDSSDRRRRVISSWFWCQLAVGLIVALVFILLAPQISNLLLGSQDYALLIRLVALAIPLGTFGKVLGNWLRYQRRAWLTTAYFTTTSLTTVGAIFLFVLILHQGLEGLYQAQLIAAALMAAVAALILRSWIGPRHASSGILKEMLHFGLPLVPAAVTAWVTASSDRLILPIFQGRAENC
jgi:O-antigen/teichoic acid export membrane protein